MRWSSSYHDACKLQRILIAEIENPDTRGTAKSALCNAWEKLEERKRIIRMKPAPKAVDVTVKEKPLAMPKFRE